MQQLAVLRKAESVVELAELVARVKCLEDRAGLQLEQIAMTLCEDLHENATTRLNDLENYQASEAPHFRVQHALLASAKR